MQAKTTAILLSFALFLFIIELIRREKMTFKYSVFWLGASGVILGFAFFDKLLFRLSALAGFELPSNFVFFLALTFFLVLTLLLTVYINEQNSRSESLAQTVGILQHKIEELEKKKN